MIAIQRESRTNCAHPIRMGRCAQLVRLGSANCAHHLKSLRAVRPVISARIGELTNCAHPPIPPRGACGQLAAAPEPTARALEVRARSSSSHGSFQRRKFPKGHGEQPQFQTDFRRPVRSPRAPGGSAVGHDVGPRGDGRAGVAQVPPPRAQRAQLRRSRHDNHPRIGGHASLGRSPHRVPCGHRGWQVRARCAAPVGARAAGASTSARSTHERRCAAPCRCQRDHAAPWNRQKNTLPPEHTSGPHSHGPNRGARHVSPGRPRVGHCRAARAPHQARKGIDT